MNNENNMILTEQEIMNILTSPEWREKPFTMPIVYRAENDETQVQQKLENKLSNKTVKSKVNNDLHEITDQAKMPIDKNEIVLPIAKESFDCFKSIDSMDEQNSEVSSCSLGRSSREFTCSKIVQKTKSPTAKKNKNVIFENLISDDHTSLKLFKNYHIVEDFKSKKHDNTKDKIFTQRKKEFPLKQDSAYSSQLSTGDIWTNKTLMRNFSLNANSYDSDVAESCSTWSFDTPVMARIIQQNKSRDYVIGKQTNDESSYRATMEQAMEKTKLSLGKLLVEGLHKVSKRYRRDPFKYLGQWLLVQADIRDENTPEGIIDDGNLT